jgi:truncated hemoglobin YjbI
MNAVLPHKYGSALPHAAPGPVLPRAGQSEFALSGYLFKSGEPPAGVAGLFALTRQIGDFLYPVLIGEGGDLAAAFAQAEAGVPGLADAADGRFWMERAQGRQRAHILRDLVGKFDPPLNVEFRRSRAAPEIAALVPDRAGLVGAPAAEHLSAEIKVSEAELRELVRAFYATAREDSLIGPVFQSAVADWEHHFDVIANFWSRTLLGTQRYTGNPFAPHVSLNLKPEFFDRWLEIFKPTAARVLPPAAAERAIAKVEHMSACFQAGLFLPATAEQAVG